MSDASNMQDLREFACARPPRVAYDLLERGAEDDVSMRENRPGRAIHPPLPERSA